MIKRVFLFSLLIVILFGGVLWIKHRQDRQAAERMAQPPPPITVAAVKVVREHRQPMLRSVGSLVAVNGIEVSAEVGGIVRQIAFGSGQWVKEGDVLLRLDDAVDRSELGALRADLELAKIEFERVKKLLPKKAVSKSDFDKVEATFQSAAARVDEQGAVVQRKTVRAPFSGLLGIRLVDLGQYLSPGEGIVGLQSLDPIYVDYTLPERYFQRVRVGQDVEVRLDAVPGRVFRGSVVAMESSILEGTRTIRLRAQLKNRDRSLRPGMFAEVETLEGAPREILSLPQTAVSHNTYCDFVLAISEQEDGSLVANPRQVSTGTVREGRVEILEGVQEGDRVVRAGLNKVRPGLPLVIDNQVELRDADLSIR